MTRQDSADHLQNQLADFRLGNFSLGGHRFHSRSEAACAIIMQLFIPGFTVSPGLNFQVLIGRDQFGNHLSVDFMVNDVLFEYHPPRHRTQASMAEGYKTIRVKRLSGKHRGRHSGRRNQPTADGRFRQHCFQYYKKRRKQLDRNPSFRGRRLIVASTPEEFYEKVLHQFGRHPLPTKEEFLELFRILQNEVEYVSWPASNKRRKNRPKKKPQKKRRAKSRAA